MISQELLQFSIFLLNLFFFQWSSEHSEQRPEHLNSLSAVIITDLLQLGCRLEVSEDTSTVISKLISLVFEILNFGNDIQIPLFPIQILIFYEYEFTNYEN